MKSKNKIIDSFEEFLKLPISILKNRIIQITGYRSDFMTSKSIDIELSDDAIHINCVNSESAYNLLSSVIYKKQLAKKRLLKERLEKSAESTPDSLVNVDDKALALVEN